MAAVPWNWFALEFVSEEMKGDRELCTAAGELCMAAVA